MDNFNETPRNSMNGRHSGRTYGEADRAMHAADVASYEARFGHVERRHAELGRILGLLQLLTCAAGGLLMALGFHPFITFVASVLAWRAISDVTSRHQAADLERRSAHGVD